MGAVLRLAERSEVWVPVCMGYYEVSHDGRVRRVAPARGTFPGKELKPYRPKGAKYRYVKLHAEGRTIQISLDLLLDHTFNRAQNQPSRVA